jgi:uncharacterized protein YbjT (DUF2867 family)
MKIVVIGGSGFIGSKLVKELRKFDHIVIAASYGAANNSNAGKLGEMLKNAKVVIDVSNAPSSDDKEIIEFFQTSGHNLMAAEMIAGVKHHITFSLVGIENLLDNSLFKGKKMQENLVKDSEIPYTILQATQFYELVRGIAQSATVGEEIRVPDAKVQLVASDDVAAAISDISVGKPLNITVQIAGPERFPLNELVKIFLEETKDPRKVIVDTNALYFGVEIEDESLLPGKNALIGKTKFRDWLRKQDK